jgi:hypothetical protein
MNHRGKNKKAPAGSLARTMAEKKKSGPEAAHRRLNWNHSHKLGAIFPFSGPINKFKIY